MPAGLTVGAVGLVMLTRIGTHSDYVTAVLPATFVFGAGLGLVFASAFGLGTLGVSAQDAGVASATLNVANQVGGSVGTALLNTIFASAVTSYLTLHVASARVIGREALAGLALAHGYDTAFWWIAGIFAGGAIVGGLLFRRGPLYRQDGQGQQAAGVMAGTEAGPALLA